MWICVVDFKEDEVILNAFCISNHCTTFRYHSQKLSLLHFFIHRQFGAEFLVVNFIHEVGGRDKKKKVQTSKLFCSNFNSTLSMMVLEWKNEVEKKIHLLHNNNASSTTKTIPLWQICDKFLFMKIACLDSTPLSTSSLHCR